MLAKVRECSVSTKLKVALFICFFVPVLVQSVIEWRNYASGVHNTASWTVVDENITYPDLAVCKKEQFKSSNVSFTADAFLASTYSEQDIFDFGAAAKRSYAVPAEKLRISSLYTRFHGRCYLIQVPESINYKSPVAVTFKNVSTLKLYILGTDQDLCLTLGYCNHALFNVKLRSSVTSIFLKTKKTIIAPSKCNSSEAYNWKTCTVEAIREELAAHDGCILPNERLAFAPHLDNATMCSDLKSYQEAYMSHYTLFFNAVSTDNLGCLRDCVYRQDTADVSHHTESQMKAVLPWERPGAVHVKLMSPTVTMNKEYEVYDFNRLLGSVGGSLGMFVGLSFMDLMLTAAKRVLRCASLKGKA